MPIRETFNRQAHPTNNSRNVLSRYILPIVFCIIFGAVGVYVLTRSFATTVNGTFGKTSIGTSCDTFVNDMKRVNHYAVSQTVTVNQLNIYLKPSSTSGSQPVQGVLYADSNGSPSSLVATTNVLTFSNTKTAGWYNLTFASAPTIQAGTYWIGVLTGSTARVTGYCYDTSTDSHARAYNANTYTSGAANPFGSASFDTRSISLYASYTQNIYSPPPTASLTASPSTIILGRSITLIWSSTNATNCSAPWTTSAATTGSQVLTPSATTTYKLTCSGDGGSVIAQTSVTVTKPNPPPPASSSSTSSSSTTKSTPPPAAQPTTSVPSPTQPDVGSVPPSKGNSQTITTEPKNATVLGLLISRYGREKVAIAGLGTVIMLIVGGFFINHYRHAKKDTTMTNVIASDNSLPTDMPSWPYL